jgi:hypothetical protein
MAMPQYGWRRAKLCDIVSNTDESQRCALRQPAKLVGMIAGKLKNLLAEATTAITHLAAPNRDASRPL